MGGTRPMGVVGADVLGGMRGEIESGPGADEAAAALFSENDGPNGQTLPPVV